MADPVKLAEQLDSDRTKALFASLYGPGESDVSSQVLRYKHVLNRFSNYFDTRDVCFFSAPGRTEIGGNHTDHNAGIVLAASVNLDSIATAARTDDGVVTVHSEGYDQPFRIRIDDLAPREGERETTTALIRGIAGRFRELGYQIGGFDAYISSNVAVGSGLSSSASIEVLLGTIFNAFFNGGIIPPETVARIGQYAENTYFGKPCGLMDQLASAVGGVIMIDFQDPEEATVRKVNFDFDKTGYKLLVVNTGGSHADLTSDYAAVPGEMKDLARALGAGVCREVSSEKIMNKLPDLRKAVGDRAILRAFHFLDDNERVLAQVQALEQDNFSRFLHLVNESGNSSFRWLQNCFSPQNPREQGVSLALLLTERFQKGIQKGACRVHGGGFAGTIQVFLPDEQVVEYVSRMEGLFGTKAVYLLNIRHHGALSIDFTFKRNWIEAGKAVPS